MQLIALALWGLLWLFSATLWVRFGLDWFRQAAPHWRPRGLMLFLAETAYTITDPPMNFLRRFIKPLRIGVVAIDFSWTILLIITYILMSFLD